MKENHNEIGVGPTDQLRLRVSVATLVRVLFNNPIDGRMMLALEHTATLREIEGHPEVIVRAKPFGGAVQIINPQALEKLIGNFHYDSERSRQERDFRIQIHPSSWEKVKDICQQHFNGTMQDILDPSPERELAEEFEDALRLKITQNDYQLKLRGIMIEDLPSETENVRAVGLLTVRAYYIFEAWIESPELIARILANDSQYSDQDLQNIAQEDALKGGRGRANALLSVALNNLKDIPKSIAMDRLGGSIQIEGHHLSRNVLAILD